MIEKTFKVTNQTGLDAKISSLIVNKCGKYNCDIKLRCANETVNLKSIMGVMSLNIHKGLVIDIIFDGEDEEAAANDICFLINDIKLAKEF